MEGVRAEGNSGQTEREEAEGMVLRTKDEPEQGQPPRGQSSVMRTRQEQRCQSSWPGVSQSAQEGPQPGDRV